MASLNVSHGSDNRNMPLSSLHPHALPYIVHLVPNAEMRVPCTFSPFNPKENVFYSASQETFTLVVRKQFNTNNKSCLKPMFKTSYGIVPDTEEAM